MFKQLESELTSEIDVILIEAFTLIELYHELVYAGGNLHIILDDGNIGDDHIDCCESSCIDRSDSIGMRICSLIRKLPLDIRDLVTGNNDYDRYGIFQDAKDRVSKQLSIAIRGTL